MLLGTIAPTMLSLICVCGCETEDVEWNNRMAGMRTKYMQKYCDTRTDLLYAIPGTDADRDARLPDPKLVRQQKPDYRGYGTGMSDTALFGGKVLGAFCEAYDATGDERIAPDARRLFKGLTFMMTGTKEPASNSMTLTF